MIHGLGQPHNADVLMSPPIQIPFYFPTRLLVECKCYEQQLGLSITRNILGLRIDINSFEIVDREILQNRRNYRRERPHDLISQRFIYQVALASMSGFKRTAIDFANTHRIPLISFSQSEIFKKVKLLINELDSDANRDYVSEKEFHDFLSGRIEINKYLSFCHIRDVNNITLDFVMAIRELTDHMSIGLLENGTILFLYGDERQYGVNRFDSNEFELHWYRDKKSWKLTSGDGRVYLFELPRDMIKEWKTKTDNWQNEFTVRKEALYIKAEYFPQIILFRNMQGEIRVEVLRINKSFLDRAVHAIEN